MRPRSQRDASMLCAYGQLDCSYPPGLKGKIAVYDAIPFSRVTLGPLPLVVRCIGRDTWDNQLVCSGPLTVYSGQFSREIRQSFEEGLAVVVAGRLPQASSVIRLKQDSQRSVSQRA